MPKYKQHFVYSIVTLILFQLLRKCGARSVFAVENNLVGTFNNNHDNEIGFAESHNTITNDNNSYIAISKPTTPFISPVITKYSKQLNKWSMGTRVTRRQYEIINMLWRKTKIFVEQTDPPNQEFSSSISDQNNITTKTLLNLIEKKHPVVFTTRLPVVQITSTPSNIEFYYFNNANNKEEANKNCIFGTKCKKTIANNFNFSNAKKSNSSFVVFHIKGPAIGEPKEMWYESQRLQTKIREKNFFTTRKPNFFDIRTKKSHSASVVLKKKAYTKILNITTNKAKSHSVSDKIVLNGSCLSSATKAFMFLKGSRNDVGTTKFYKGTTAYDKIKFFEIYDRMTPTTNSKNGSVFPFDYDEELNKPNEAQNEKILLSHVDQGSHDHDKAKHFKKHITEDQNRNTDISCSNSNEENKKPTKFVFKTKNVKKNSTHHLIEFERKSLTDDILYTFSNKTVHWSEYPFAAVYVYEPSQIQCDAAGISPHWLVASGSCLSRLNKNPNGEGRSAFVTYCGENWWHPERVSYVKYSLVHPWFHPTDKTRRHLYNIGVIQVVTSMTTCSGWAPVNLMSHQFQMAQKGTQASAVGWGLDRFATRFATTMHLPKTPLTVYNGLLFSDSCPGNYEYSDAKLYGDNGYLKSLYCLSLPPYFGEDRDPVHGGLLLVDGKLIALYLQEERRPWGEQSAQYTGVWRLIPWIMDVARETDDIGTSYIEI